MDVQGAELMILENAQTILNNVIIFQTEADFIELFKGQPSFGELDGFIRSEEFNIFSFCSLGLWSYDDFVCDYSMG